MKLTYFKTAGNDIVTVEKNGIVFCKKDGEHLPIFNGGDGADELIARRYLQMVAEKKLYEAWEPTTEKISGEVLAEIEEE